MNKLRPFSAIGTPFHGLATNGTLPDAGSGAKSVIDDFYAVGVAVPAIHPAAPGTSRNAAQAARDATLGYTWRDYALLCGDARAFDGIPDWTLGVNKWLYSDTAGGTWVIRLDATVNATSITFDVYLEALFGRYGKARTHSETLLDSLEWTPDIPSWYTAGTYDAGDVVTDGVDLDWVNTLAISPDGAEVYINITSTDVAINDDLYQETTPSGSKAYYNRSIALVGVCKVVLSGVGDLEASGAGISAVISEDLTYEGGLVTARTQVTGETAPAGLPCSGVDIDTTPIPAYPGDNCTPETTQGFVETYTPSLNGDASGAAAGDTFAHTAILYRTPDGDVVRAFEINDQSFTWDVTVSGGFTVTQTLSTCGLGKVLFRGGPWFYDGSYVGAGTPITADYTYVWTDRTHVTVTLFGTVVIDQDIIYETTREGCWECANTLDSPTGALLAGPCQSAPYFTDNTVATINGASTTGTNMYAAHEYRTLAQNLHYVATYTSQANNEATQDLIETVVGVAATGSASTVWTGADTDTYRPASSAFPDLPVVRELVWAYQPVTGDITHGSLNTTIAYTGDTYLYV